MKCGHCKDYGEGGFCLRSRKLTGYLTPACNKFASDANLLNYKSKQTTMETKVCKDCGRELPLDQFQPQARSKDGHMHVCRDCMQLRKGHKSAEKEEKEPEAKEAVNHPSHYQMPNGAEALDIARYMSFNLGNALKYIVRAGRKDASRTEEDLLKAKFYIEDEIRRINGD